MPWKRLLALALLVCGLNSLKPLHIDDTAYWFFAQHIAGHPADPYGFDIFWYDWPEPAMGVLAPPVVPYWWAAGIALLGERPWLWKLWFFPFVAALTLGVHGLGRRLAGGMAGPLTLLIVLSPVVLPGMNLMLDVPAMALSLLSLWLVMEAGERKSALTAVAAGLAAGLAMQTKYTAVAAPAAMLLYGLTTRRLPWTLLAAAVASAVFVGWEGWLALSTGQSHFLYHLGLHDTQRTLPKANLYQPLLTLAGGLAPILILLALAAWGEPWLVVAMAGSLIAGGLGLIVVSDWKHTTPLVLSVLGALTWLTTLAAAGRGWLQERRNQPTPTAHEKSPAGEQWPWVFLCLWLATEVGLYLAMAPFPASRRFQGMWVTLALLTGRAAWVAGAWANRRALIATIVAGGVALGLGYFALDWRDAQAARQVVERAAAVFRQRQANLGPETVWYAGHWGFDYYARQAGFVPLIPDHSLVKAGDWLVLPLQGVDVQKVGIPADAVVYRTSLTQDDALAVGMIPFYASGLSLEHRWGPRVQVRLMRAVKDFVPVLAYPPTGLLEWALARGRPLTPWAAPALARLMAGGDVRQKEQARALIQEAGPRALAFALAADDARVAAWAQTQLQAAGALDGATRAVLESLRKEGSAAGDRAAAVLEKYGSSRENVPANQP